MLTLLFVLFVVGVVGVVAAVAVGRIGGGMADPVTTVPAQGLPQGPLEPLDVDRLRFEVSFRGYRMHQVDAALDRLRSEIGRYAEEQARVRAELAAVTGPLDLGTGDGARAVGVVGEPMGAQAEAALSPPSPTERPDPQVPPVPPSPPGA